MSRCTTPTSLALLALFALPAGAQSYKLAEPFEDLDPPGAGQQGPPALVARGWTFRNQSDPLGGAAAWRPGGSPGWPSSGEGFLAGTSTAAGTFGAKLSTWAILPPVPGQVAGDLLTIHVLDGNLPSSETYLDVRYSPFGSAAFAFPSETDPGTDGAAFLGRNFQLTPVPLPAAAWLFESGLVGLGSFVGTRLRQRHAVAQTL